jgi:hypothetical protein
MHMLSLHIFAILSQFRAAAKLGVRPPTNKAAQLDLLLSLTCRFGQSWL